MTVFEKFIIEHENEEAASLMLSASLYRDIDMRLAANTIGCRRRLKNKVPEWYSITSLIYPDRLCAEQCSSSETARYKAGLAEKIIGKKGRVADLTGGLGIDSWAFSSIAEKVLYNERNPELSKAASRNYKKLNINNISISNEKITSGRVSFILKDFQPDIIYLDPSRRSPAGTKVFKIEDCEPDLLSIKDELLESCENILVKLSPMADTSLAVSKLGPGVREVHIVGAQGECKELLIWINKNWHEACPLIVYNSGKILKILPEEEKQALAVFWTAGSPMEGKFLIEPGKALMKAGYYNGLSSRFRLKKLGVSTHLYVSDAPPEELAGLCKVFKIKQLLTLNNKNIKIIGKTYGSAEITAKNLPLSSESLRKKAGVKPGAGPHIFGARVDSIGNCLIVTERVPLKS